jgi:xanthine dehydrogenase YagR molybdenum-binding subunit
MTRQQMFTFGHRPETLQRVKLAAERDGTLRAIVHTAVAETSRFEDYVEVVVNWSGQLYACDNIKLGYRLVSLDQYSPIDMRAPGAAHGVHALEVAMDELAHALRMDPLALRLKNYAERNPMDGMPYSTKELAACYHQGAERFGWAARPLEPRSMREGNEWVGWGMATGTWDAMQMFARASAVFHADGRLVVSSAATDIGTGTYTVMGMIAAAAMGLPLERVSFQLGDSTLPVAPIEGGSSHVTTVGSAVQGVREAATQAVPHGPRAAAFAGGQGEVRRGRVRRRTHPPAQVARQRHRAVGLMSANDMQRVEEKYLLLPSVLKQRKYVRATHSAVFCEVKVDEALGTVRVTRVVSAIAAGRILSAKTARSQVTGAVVWGISQALHEETHADHRLGRFMNHNLAEYHVAVNADIHDIDVIFVQEDDRVVSELGAKGVGEIGIVGVAAAVSNAIFHATGRRVRSTPMTPDKVMAP